MFSRSCNITAQSVLTYIDAHFDEPIAPHDVAAGLHYSLCYLTHVTRKMVGLSVGDLLIRRRIDAAQRLLEETAAPVAWVATRVGFSDMAYFSRRFSQQTGSSPSRWRSRHRRPRELPRICNACGRPLALVAPLQHGTAEIPEAAS